MLYKLMQLSAIIRMFQALKVPLNLVFDSRVRLLHVMSIIGIRCLQVVCDLSMKEQSAVSTSCDDVCQLSEPTAEAGFDGASGKGYIVEGATKAETGEASRGGTAKEARAAPRHEAGSDDGDAVHPVQVIIT